MDRVDLEFEVLDHDVLDRLPEDDPVPPYVEDIAVDVAAIRGGLLLDGPAPVINDAPLQEVNPEHVFVHPDFGIAPSTTPEETEARLMEDYHQKCALMDERLRLDISVCLYMAHPEIGGVQARDEILQTYMRQYVENDKKLAKCGLRFIADGQFKALQNILTKQRLYGDDLALQLSTRLEHSSSTSEQLQSQLKGARNVILAFSILAVTLLVTAVGLGIWAAVLKGQVNFANKLASSCMDTA